MDTPIQSPTTPIAPTASPATPNISSSQPSTPKWTTQSFATAYRQKVPNGITNSGVPFSQLSDQDLVSKVVAKHPVYRSQISDYSEVAQPIQPKIEEGNPVTDYAKNLKNDISDNSDSQKIAGDIQRAGDNFNTASNPLTKAGALLHGLYQVGGHVLGGAFGKAMAPLTALGETAGQDSATVQSAATSAPVNAAADAVHPAVQGLADWAQKHPDAASDLNATMQYAGFLIGGNSGEGALNTVKEGVDTGVNAAKEGATAVKEAATTAATKASQAAAKEQAVRTAAQTAKDTAKGTNIIAPKLTSGEMGSALATGKVKNVAPGKLNILGKVKADFSEDPHLQAVYHSVKDFLNPKAETAYENLQNVRNGISAVSEHEVKPHLEQHPVPFNFEDLRGYLDNVHPSPAIKSDPQALVHFNRTKEDILSVAEQHLRGSQTAGGKDVASLTDVNDLWNPGKAIDDHIQQQLGESTFDTPQYTGIKAAATAMRDGFRHFMSDSMRYPGQMEKFNKFRESVNTLKEKGIPMDAVKEEDLASQMGLHSDPEHAANAAFLDRMMAELAKMHEARDNLGMKAREEQGTSKYSRFMKEHPYTHATTRTAIRTGAIAAGVHPFVP